MEAVDEVNEAAEAGAVRRRSGSTSATTSTGKTLAVWGLAFKPRTDDIREAPALVLIDALLAAGAQRARPRPGGDGRTSGQIYGDKLVYCDRPYGALEGADGLAIVTEWQEFRNPDFEVMQPAADASRSSSTAATCTSRRRWRRRGFTYYSIGRATAGAAG